MNAAIPWPLPLGLVVLLVPIGLAAIVLGLMHKFVGRGGQ